jgi:lysophospholipase L1-like esterase
MRRRLGILLTILIAGLVIGPASAPPVGIYVALGDSVAAGRGASQPALSYTGRELERLRSQAVAGRVWLDSYATGGATSDGLLRWQVPRAAERLAALRDGRLAGRRAAAVTVTIGGNDLLALTGQAFLSGQLPSEATVAAAAAEVERNVELALAALVTAAGPGVPITVTTYYNPFPTGETTESFDRLGRRSVEAVNSAIVRAAEQYPQQVRVARVDLLLPNDGAIRTYLADEIHPNDRGHAVIASAVARAWERERSSGRVR